MIETNLEAKGLFKEFIYLFQLHRDNPPSHPWDSKYKLLESEKACVADSIRQFELGEGSDGKLFIKRAKQFSERSGHSSYETAVRLFIEEEQRHSRMLRDFLSREGIATIESHWVDWCFRKLRHLAGAETTATVLVTAELIARPYYRALRGATKSPLLRSICQQIISEEEVHIDFQAASVAAMQLGRSRAIKSLCKMGHLLFMEATCRVAWREHKSVFIAGNFTFEEFRKSSIDGVALFYRLLDRHTKELEERATSYNLLDELNAIERAYGSSS